MSKRQKQELEEIPEKINVLELEQADIGEVLSDPNLYVSNPGLVEQHQKRLLEIEAEIEALMEKWETLSAIE